MEVISLLNDHVIFQTVLTIESKGFDHHEKHSELFLKKARSVSFKTSALASCLVGTLDYHEKHSELSLK